MNTGNTKHTPEPWRYRRQHDGQFIDMLSALHLARIAINADALADSANNGSSWFEARAVALGKIDAAFSKAEGRA